MHGMIAPRPPEAVGSLIDAFGWDEERIAEAIEQLARAAGLPTAARATVRSPSVRQPDGEIAVEAAAAALGFEAQPVAVPLSGLDDLVRRSGPALIHVRCGLSRVILVLLGNRRGNARLMRPDLSIGICPLPLLRDAIAWRIEAPHRPGIDDLIGAVGLPTARADRARTLLLDQRLGDEIIEGVWLLRPSFAAPTRPMLRYLGAWQRLTAIVAVFALGYLLEIYGWSVIGDAALNGRLDMGWLAAWMLLLLSTVPLRLIGEWCESVLAVDVGSAIKGRLLAGALNVDLDALKTMGAGHLLSRVIESQAFEATVLTGAMGALVATIELAFAGWVLSKGSGGATHTLLLVAFTPVALGLALLLHRRLDTWTSVRLSFTHGLIERMEGHRTRLAQEQPERRDATEDRLMKDYFTTSRAADRAALPFVLLVPAIWMLLGLAALTPAFVGGTATSNGLAIALGGVLLATRAFSSLVDGLGSIMRAVIAWRHIGFIYRAAEAPGPVGAGFIAPPRAAGDGAFLVELDDVAYRYEAKGRMVVEGASLSIRHGQRLLLEGPSGGGKSTLASLIAGLRRPDRGLIHVHGLDRETLGDSWRAVISQAPQFHENHILSASLAFNLLMGRQWPPSAADLEEAHTLCLNLGLGPTLERMPAGLMQHVGETGWQLSHGEKSRIFLARALLQKTELVILDETFAALDPRTQAICLKLAFRHAPTLAVIAHR